MTLPPLAVLLISAWFISCAVMLLAWLLYVVTRLPSIVDVFWSIAIAAVGFFFLHQGGWDLRSQIIASCLLIWALRLAGFLFWTRIRVKEVDPRYESLLSNWNKKTVGYFFNYQLQAILAFIIAAPFYFIGQAQQAISNIDIVLACLFVVALGLETLADWQLNRFKKSPTGPVCNVGLWRYSRHPNYFFEWCIWLCFAGAAIMAPNGYLGLVSPLLLLWIMLGVTGPVTERNSLKSRGDDYKAYQRRTSMFIPLPPKSN